MPEATTTAAGVNKRLIAFTAGLVALSILEYWLIFTWDGVTLGDKLSAVLAIIGAYGIGLGFARRSLAEASVARELAEHLTSPNAALCWGTNAVILGIITMILPIGLAGPRRSRQPAVLALLSTLALTIMALGLVGYVFFHALVVVPIAYPAILVAAGVVNAFDTAAGDTALAVAGRQRDKEVRLSLKAIVLKDKPASTAFVMGLPAAVLALIGRVFAPFFS
ncbi:MAG TPA: hypothetical protein VKP12_14060 [Kiloniellaceae bacterium]|nr:hypothetical protein [Kiloniellaceae bacterium]